MWKIGCGKSQAGPPAAAPAAAGGAAVTAGADAGLGRAGVIAIARVVVRVEWRPAEVGRGRRSADGRPAARLVLRPILHLTLPASNNFK